MDWRDVDYEHLLKAMDIVDRIGVDAARARCNAAISGVGYGFQPAKAVLLCHVGRGEYEHRVLVALAYRLQHPDRRPLCPKDFHGIAHREFFHSMNNRIGPRFGWTRIEPDPEVERAFDEAVSRLSA